MSATALRDDPEAAAALFSALGDTTRLTLVLRLSEGAPLSVTQLGEGLPLTRQAVAKHLRVLEGAGLLSGEKRGRERIYSLEAERLRQGEETLAAISTGWDRALLRLKAFVEED